MGPLFERFENGFLSDGETGLTRFALAVFGLVVLLVGARAENQIVLKSNEAQLRALFILDAQTSMSIAKATQIRVVAKPSLSSDVRFNQPVGGEMKIGLRRARDYVKKKHGGWVKGADIELSFGDSYSRKGGSSASLACGLLLDALFTGARLDPTVAVTGELATDGSVTGVRGVAAKIRGAIDRGGSVVLVPLGDHRVVADAMLVSGTGDISRIQVFAVKTISEAKRIALSERPADLAEAITLFGRVQGLIRENPGAVYSTLRSRRIHQVLRRVRELAPNHLSAALLLRWGTGRAPKMLTLGGSFDYLEQVSDALLEPIRSGVYRKPSGITTSELVRARSDLNKLRPKLDQRVIGYADAIGRFGRLLQKYVDLARDGNKRERTKILTEIDRAARQIEDEYGRLSRDPEIVSELRR